MAIATPTARDVRRHNRRSVLQAIYFNAPISRLELSQVLGLSPATVTNVTGELLAEGLVVESGVVESQGGRPRTTLMISAHYGYIIGVDLGETHIQIGLFTFNLEKLEATTYPLAAGESDPQHVVERIAQGIELLLASRAVTPEAVIGVGVGVPGIVQLADDLAVFAPEWGWHGVPLLRMLRERLALPFLVDNGAKAMALAEMRFGAGRHVDNLAVVLVGTGVGAGIGVGGQLYRGACNSAGEWGHTKLMLDGRHCRCGGAGCLEAYVGAPGIIETLRELAPRHELLGHSDQLAIISAIVEAAQHGDPLARRVMQQTMRYLAAGLANLINVFNPQKVVLGGWAGLLAGRYMLPALAAEVARHALTQPFASVTIGLCEFGQDAVCEGAATLALDHFLGAGGRRDSLPPTPSARVAGS